MSRLRWVLAVLATSLVILHICNAAAVPPLNAAEAAKQTGQQAPAAGHDQNAEKAENPQVGNTQPVAAKDAAAGNNPPPKENNHPPAQDVKQQGGAGQLTVIAEHPDCVADVKRLCAKQSKAENENQQQRIQHNFEILECFMSYEGDDQPPSAACQTVVYNYKADLSKDERFDEAAKSVCQEFIEKSELNQVCTSQEKGAFLPCLIEHAYDLNEEDEKHTPCYKFLNKMEMVIFSDYHLVHDFIKMCKSDVEKFKCGRVFDDREQDNQKGMEQHMQGATIACLESHMQDLGKECKKEIMNVAELQADDYHLDRPLYFACKQDRRTLCGAVKNGEGKVYECLMQNQNNPKMSEQCRKEMVRREQMMQEDIKVNKGFYEACKDILKHYECPLEPQHDQTHVAMSSALLCLRNADENAKEDKRMKPSEECVKEIETFSSVLMNDFQVDVEVVHNCQQEIQQHCRGMKEAQHEDGTIHCLMSLAMPARKDDKEDKKAFKSVLNDKCLASLSNLVEEADAFEHNAVDGYLMEQCQQEIRDFCANEKDNPVDCLLDKIEDGTLPQTNECVKHILELQYFVSRNYKMDHKLVKACKDDLQALKLHHEMKQGEQGPDPQGIVFGQLWKVVRDQLRVKKVEERGENERPVSSYDVSDKCIKEVLRVVHERAVSIDLMPELEQACMTILSTSCADAPPGEEMKCLQEKYDEIDDKEHPECKELLGQFIEDQDADAQLDYILMKSCEPSIQKYCKPAMDAIERGNADDGAVIECLIDNKFQPDMDKKCFAGIEHHQLVNMKSYNFNTKFREACKQDYEKFCVHKTNRVDVILCLSEAVRNDTLLDQPQRISDHCRKQLTAESLKWEEAIHLDPQFQQACAKTLEKHCKNVKVGPGEDPMDAHLKCVSSIENDVLEKQDGSCARYLFKHAEMNNMLAGAGAMVFRMCKADIKKFCDGHREPEKLLECLDENYEDLSQACQTALDKEEEEDNEDIRLNPALYMPCRKDINSFCKDIMDKAETADSHTLHGQVIECLKLEYVKGSKSRLSDSCTNQMHLLAVKVQTRDYKQDYILTHECQKEISECSEKNAGQKEIISCLKEKLFKGELRDDKKCQDEVFRLITENRVDIHTDRELYDACRTDIASSPCGILPAGSGRVMSCLLSLHEAGNVKDPHCRDTLANRKELWQKAAKMVNDGLSPPETLKEVWDDLTTSSSRYYFLSVVLAVVFVVLLVGMLCGRWTKRVAAEIKNR